MLGKWSRLARMLQAIEKLVIGLQASSMTATTVTAVAFSNT